MIVKSAVCSLTLVNVWASVWLAHESIILTDQKQIKELGLLSKKQTVVNRGMTSKVPKEDS